MRYLLPDINNMADRLRNSLDSNEIAARAAGFALVSSNDRSYGLQILGVEPEFEPFVSTIPGLVKQGRYLAKDAYDFACFIDRANDR